MTATTIFSHSPSNSQRCLEACLQKTASSNHFKLGKSHRIFQVKQSLFSAGDIFEGVYIMRSGSAKAFVNSVDGEEHITKFLFPGDLVGIEGFDTHAYMQNVHFLETSSVYLVKELELMELIQNDESFRHCLLQKMSHSVVTDNAMMLCLSTHSSEQKVAQFVLELSEKFHQLNLSASELNLSMTRTDISHYLGMALETLSRVFASFQQQSLIKLNNRQLTILNHKGLRSILSQHLASNAKMMRKPQPNKQPSSLLQ